MTQVTEVAQQYGFNSNDSPRPADMVQIEQARAMSEVQASVAMAKRFPRDINQAFANIMKACQRPSLAEQAMYAYPRGKETVEGPSIRLAEVITQNWGNINFGIREISQVSGISVAQAYAWDLETNVKQIKEFQVPHKRYTKNGAYDLNDPRDIYELVANQGARRLRACLLGIIPPDIIEAAQEMCEKTMKDGKEPIQDRGRKLALAFAEMGVNVTQIEKRLGHKLEAIIETEIVKLRAIYKSLKDGMAKREDFFEFGTTEDTSNKDTKKSDNIASKLKSKKESERENNIEQNIQKPDNLSFDEIEQLLIKASTITELSSALETINTQFGGPQDQIDSLRAYYEIRVSELKEIQNQQEKQL